MKGRWGLTWTESPGLAGTSEAGFSEGLVSFYHCRSEVQSRVWLYSMWPLVSAGDDLGGSREGREGARVFW